MSYTRVVPRDFFNEAKLLKCLGRLELIILDKLIKIPLVSEFDGEPFNIQQNINDGSINVTNYTVSLNNEEIFLFTPLNSKENYPLYGIYRGEEYCIFSETGEFLPNFGVNNEE